MAAAPPRQSRPHAKPRLESGESGEIPVRDEFLFRIRAFPRRHIPLGARMRAFQQAERLRPPRALIDGMSAANVTAASGQWTLAGPQPTAEGYSGRVTAIAVDPRDNNTVYIGGAEGGVWKTTDGGSNWKPLTDLQPTLAIGSLAIDPSNPDTVYAGTGEANFNYDAYNGMGVLKSTDSGRTWTLLGSDIFQQANIGSLAVCPADGKVLLAATPFGLFRSADAGVTWNVAMSDMANSVLFDPSNGATAYAAIIGFGDTTGVYKSLDSGKTWTLSNGAGVSALQLPKQTFRLTLTLAPSAPSTLYLGVDSTTGRPSPLAAFYKSTDAGGSWTQIPGQAYCADQCWYNNVLAVSPVDPNLLLGGGVGLEFSINGGTSWNFTGRYSLHADQHAIAFTKDGSRVYVGNDGGVWTAPTAGGLFVWSNLNATLALTQFYKGLSIKPGDPSLSFGGTQDNGSLVFSAAQWQAVGCGDGAATAIDPVSTQNVYIACGGLEPGLGVVQKSSLGGSPGTFQSRDGGISASEGVPFIPYLTIDPSNPQNLYFTGNQHIYQSTNGAGYWTAISPDVTSGGLWPCAIAVAPGDSNTVYTGSCDGVAKVTRNALSGSASKWEDISAGLPGMAITHVAVDTSSPLKAFATTSGFFGGHVFLTQDGGHSWTGISGNLPDTPVNELLIDPDLEGTLYVATDSGVFWTNSTGKTWTALDAGLPHAAVLSLAFEHSSRTLRAATHGRSVWDLVMPLQQLNLIPVLDSTEPLQIPLNFASQAVTLHGTHFASNSVVLWNGQPRATTFVSSEALTVLPQPPDVAADGLVSLTVYTPGPGGGTSLPVFIKVGPNPAVYPDGFLNAGSYLAGIGAAPGAIMAVFGVGLAAGPAAFQSLPLPVSLSDASLAVADPVYGFSSSAPLFYVSGGQMNVQIPWEAQPYSTVSLTPTFKGAQGTPVNLKIQYFAPGIFTFDQTGKGQGSITDAITGKLAAPSSKYPGAQPVSRGGYLAIYCTGLGPVANGPADGAPAPVSPLSSTYAQPVVTIGTVQGKVTFSGLAPGYVGLNQVNVQVPQDAPTGDAVSLTISDGMGTISNTVTIAIQ